MEEAVMKTSRAIILGMAATTLFSFAALAQESRQGTITVINPAKGTIAVSETQTGTTGSSATSAPQEYRLQDSLLLNAMKDGDRISYTVEEKEGAKTITKLQKQ
jgi:Cu/Ag efflux protein CusF